MKKKLTAKTQEINPPLKQFSTSFSKCLTIEPESKDLQLKKGVIYAVYEISGNANFDTSLADRALRDMLHNSYFQSENISPIQSLEKAIVESKEKILQLSNDALSAEPANVQLNISAGVLWGNVFYAVTVGESDSYLMREGAVKPIESVSEGTFAAASGIVRDEDVVILCTRQFSKNYPPQKLLSTRIGEQDLKENEACILLKFITDTSFAEEETVDFGLEKQASRTRKREKVEKIILGARKGLEKTSPIFNKIKCLFANKKRPSAPQQDISGLNRVARGKIQAETKNYDGKTFQKIAGKIVYILPILGVVLAVTLAIQLAGKKESTGQLPEQNNSDQLAVEQTESEPIQVDVAEITKDDEEFKVKRVSPEVFYDIKITDQSAEPSELVIISDFLIAADSSTGTIFKSDADTAKFVAESTKYPGLKSLINQNGRLGFLQNGQYISYSLTDTTDAESFELAGVEIINTYSDYLYGITGDKLNRYTKSGDVYEETLWGQSAEFQNSKSLTVAYSIYLITANGELTKHTSGNKNSFSIKGLNKDLTGATKVITDIDFDNIYVLDPVNQRIVVIDTDGNLVTQYTHEPQTSWDSIRDMSISSDESKIYLLNGSKVLLINNEI